MERREDRGFRPYGTSHTFCEVYDVIRPFKKFPICPMKVGIPLPGAFVTINPPGVIRLTPRCHSIWPHHLEGL